MAAMLVLSAKIIKTILGRVAHNKSAKYCINIVDLADSFE